MKTPVLEFNSTDEYIAHLKDKGYNTTKLDVEVETSKANKFGIFTVVWYAVATQRIGDYIAQDKALLMRKLSMEVSIDDDKARDYKTEPQYKIDARERLAVVRKAFEDRGLETAPGIWKV